MAATSMTLPPRKGLSTPFRWLFLFYFLLEFPLCFLGYGSDQDTYGVLDAGRSVWHNHVLATSRNPGYWVYEAAVYWLRQLGGSFAVDFAAFLMGAWLLYRIARWADRFPGAVTIVPGIALVLTPVFQFAASSGDDYLWSLACMVTALESFLDRRWLRGALFAALTMAIRAGDVIVLAGIYGGLLVAMWLQNTGRERTRALLRVVGCGMLTLAIGLLPYTLSYIWSQHNFDFTRPMMGNMALWTVKVRLGKSVYKLAYMYGPVAAVVLLAGVLVHRRALRFTAQQRTASLMCLGAFAANLVLFYKYPLEISYFLPGAYLLMLFFSFTLFRASRRFNVILLIAIGLYNLFSIDLLKGNNPGLSTRAHLVFEPTPPPLLEDIRARWGLRHCATFQCSGQVVAHEPNYQH